MYGRETIRPAMKIHLAALFLCSTAFAQMEINGPRPTLELAERPLTIELLHERAVAWFVSRPGAGISRIADRVPVGDLPVLHQVIELQGDTLSVKDVQLIGIAKHDPPVAFVLDDSIVAKSTRGLLGDAPGVPHKGMLHTFKPRPLTANEERAIEAMRDDPARNIVVAERAPESPRAPVGVVGAIRAGTSCLSCHEVKEGELLGAFSYALEVVPVSKTPAEQLPATKR